MRRLACAIFVGALGLGACGGEDPPRPAPTSAVTSAANPGATLPPMPDRADEFSPTGANRFVRYYVSVLDYASKTGDLDEIQGLSAPDCAGCTRYIDFFRDTYRKGGYIRQRWSAPGDSTVRLVETPRFESYVTLDLHISRGRYKKDSRTAEVATEKSNDTVTFALRFDGGWTVTQMWSGEYQ